MIDQQAIHADMQRIFPSGASAPAARSIGRPATQALAIMPPPPRRFMGREGIAAAGFALAVTAIGLFAAPLLKTAPSSPARVAMITPTTTLPAAAPAGLMAPAPVAAGPATPVAPVVAAAPATTAVTPPAAIQRRARPYRARWAQARRRVRARGALQRAWARDRALTRRLNQQALHRMQAG